MGPSVQGSSMLAITQFNKTKNVTQQQGQTANGAHLGREVMAARKGVVMPSGDTCQLICPLKKLTSPSIQQSGAVRLCFLRRPQVKPGLKNTALSLEVEKTRRK